MKIWYNGKFLPESEARVSVYDSSLMFGDTIFEMMRTFNKRTFQLSEHLDRLFDGLRYVGIEIHYSKDELYDAHENLIIENRHKFGMDDEIRTLINVSRGTLPIYKNMVPLGPWVMMTTFPLKWVASGMGRAYIHGVEVCIPSQRTIPARFLEPKVKNRSRLHYRMADLEVKRESPATWAILLDDDGFLAEGTGSNLFLVKNRELFTPEPRNVLRGISRQYVMSLAKQMKIEIMERNLELYDLIMADEAFFTNTPNCIVPITKINGKIIGDGLPGRITKRISTKWEESVQCEWRKQVQWWDSMASRQST